MTKSDYNNTKEKGLMKTDQKKNGLAIGWPPFAEFKKEMVELLNEAQNPLKKEMHLIKNTLVSHIVDTKKRFSSVNNTLVSHNKEFIKINKHISGIEKHLSNHVTDTNKKIVKLTAKTSEINKKLDTQNIQINKKLDKLLKNKQKSK